MNDSRQRRSSPRPPRRIVSPGGFLVMAATLAAMFLVCLVAGWRENTSFLCGTPPAGESADLAILLGLCYALSYFAFVLLVPILVLAAAIFAVLLRLSRGYLCRARATRR